MSKKELRDTLLEFLQANDLESIVKLIEQANEDENLECVYLVSSDFAIHTCDVKSLKVDGQNLFCQAVDLAGLKVESGFGLFQRGFFKKLMVVS